MHVKKTLLLILRIFAIALIVGTFVSGCGEDCVCVWPEEETGLADDSSDTDSVVQRSYLSFDGNNDRVEISDTPELGNGKEKYEKEIGKMELCGLTDYIRLCVAMQKSIILTFPQRFGELAEIVSSFSADVKVQKTQYSSEFLHSFG